MNFRKSNALESPGFQLAPMIDVVFLLLSFFAFSQLFAHWELDNDIALPTSQSGKTPKRLPGEIILNIKEDGRLTVAGRPLTQEDAATMLRQLSSAFPGQPVVIRADKATDWNHVMTVLDLCKTADIWNISFASLRPGEAAPAPAGAPPAPSAP